jgi:hypothetical protein
VAATKLFGTVVLHQQNYKMISLSLFSGFLAYSRLFRHFSLTFRLSTSISYVPNFSKSIVRNPVMFGWWENKLAAVLLMFLAVLGSGWGEALFFVCSLHGAFRPGSTPEAPATWHE